ncbi:MAG: hypothetical protein QXT19_00995 [Candidatus Woesearchaeota archaeon]
MRCKYAVIAVIVLLIVLVGCTKAECRKDADCIKPHFTGKCIDKKCAYTPIPNECGNLKCEEEENKCSCPQDCGKCEGKIGKYLVQSCNAQKECVQDIPPAIQKPITTTRELSTGGTKISVTTTFNQPFNIKKDQIELDFGINFLAPTMNDLKITRLELTGTTPDKRTIPLSDKVTSKSLFVTGKTKEKLIIDFPTTDPDGELTNLLLKIYLDYVLTSGTTTTPKSAVLQNNYQALKFVWARPEKPAGCPTSCDDKNPGTRDYCGPETNYFCINEPIAGACGNGMCDGSENKCTCPQDCGPCVGGGTYLTLSCIANKCVAQMKPGITIQPQSLFDDRDLNAFHMQNTYKYNRPFNTKTDKFALEFSIYTKQENVASIKIKDIRLLDGTEEIAFASAGKEFTEAGQKQTVELSLPAGGPLEQDRSLALRVWYEYVQDGQTKQGDYTKQLGKVVLLNPDV